MGEAKRRRVSDPGYIRPKRGLIVSAPMEIEGSKLQIKTSNLAPQELRFALLFWDRLVWPSSRAVHCGSGPDEAFFEMEGILTRPEYTVWGDAAQGMAASYIKAFQELESKEPGRWSLAQGDNSILIKDALLLPNEGTFLEIHRAIPVPDQDVALNDLLEFKYRRSSELIALQEEIDLLVSYVEGAPDQATELSNRFKEVDRRCADIIKTGIESHLPFRLSSLKASLDFRPFTSLAAGWAGWKAVEPYGITLAATSALITGAGASIRIGADFGLNTKRFALRKSPYRYVSQYHSEVFA